MCTRNPRKYLCVETPSEIHHRAEYASLRRAVTALAFSRNRSGVPRLLQYASRKLGLDTKMAKTCQQMKWGTACGVCRPFLVAVLSNGCEWWYTSAKKQSPLHNKTIAPYNTSTRLRAKLAKLLFYPKRHVLHMPSQPKFLSSVVFCIYVRTYTLPNDQANAQGSSHLDPRQPPRSARRCPSFHLLVPPLCCACLSARSSRITAALFICSFFFTA